MTTKETLSGKLFKIDLACGSRKEEGFVGVDIAASPDIHADLEKFPWSFAESDTVDEMRCSHYIEHTKDIIRFMEECWRILKVGAIFKIVAPYYTSMRAWQDPTHRQAICEATFLYYNQRWIIENKLEHYNIKANFDFNYGYVLDGEFASRNDEAKAFALRHYWNVASDIVITCTKLPFA
jgi:predicted SAM-dependent methyltransferase